MFLVIGFVYRITAAPTSPSDTPPTKDCLPVAEALLQFRVVPP